MAYPNIALIGKARSGKDTAADHLVRKHGYTRLAFADPLKEMAWRIDPWICVNDWPQYARRLSDKVAGPNSWERAKDEYPEVRRFLQALGQNIRSVDPGFWIRALLAKYSAISGPVVVTDCRYGNELAALTMAGFRTLRITRPGVSGVDAAAAQHESETALDDYAAEYQLSNSGTVADLERWLDSLLMTF